MIETVLTPAEYEVAERIALGETKRECAERTFRSVRTVETILKNVYIKLDITKVSELTLWYVGKTFYIAKQIRDLQKRVLLAFILVIALSVTVDVNVNPQIRTRRARRKHQTEVVLPTSKNVNI